jgi:hypothetical protein
VSATNDAGSLTNAPTSEEPSRPIEQASPYPDAGSDVTGEGTSAPSTPVDRHNAQCQGGCEGNPCLELSPGGYQVCSFPPAEQTRCWGDADECCSSDDCAQGKCLTTGDPEPRRVDDFDGHLHNACLSDECSGDSCGADRVCVPAGTLGPSEVNICMVAKCHQDADCTSEPDGVCRLVNDPCYKRPWGLFCSYPRTECLNDLDCDAGYYCGVAANGTDVGCMPLPLVCPDL